MVDAAEISAIVVINGNTGVRKTLTVEDYYEYNDLIELYKQLDFTAEYEDNNNPLTVRFIWSCQGSFFYIDDRSELSKEGM